MTMTMDLSLEHLEERQLLSFGDDESRVFEMSFWFMFGLVRDFAGVSVVNGVSNYYLLCDSSDKNEGSLTLNELARVLCAGTVGITETPLQIMESLVFGTNPFIIAGSTTLLRAGTIALAPEFDFWGSGNLLTLSLMGTRGIINSIVPGIPKTRPILPL